MNEEKKDGVTDYRPDSDYFFNWFLYDGAGNIVGIHGYAPDKAKEACKEYAKKYGNDKAAFEEKVRRSLMYYYWSKCEWEIVLSHWPSSARFNDRKIDVYDQVMLNWGVFMDYLWNNRKEL